MAVQEESGSALPVDIFRKYLLSIPVVVICNLILGIIRNIVERLSFVIKMYCIRVDITINKYIIIFILQKINLYIYYVNLLYINMAYL